MRTCVLSRNESWRMSLCVAHGAMEVCFVHITTSTIHLTSCFSPGKHCCATVYILHTVDSATALLNSPRTFPSRYDSAPHLQPFTHHITYIILFSRLQIPVASYRHFFSLARRLGSIFAHAYFHHREAFNKLKINSLFVPVFFLALTERFESKPNFWSYRRMAITLEISEIHWGLRLRDHLEMDIDNQTGLPAETAITATTNSTWFGPS